MQRSTEFVFWAYSTLMVPVLSMVMRAVESGEGWRCSVFFSLLLCFATIFIIIICPAGVNKSSMFSSY
jgi:hypothetical protein